MSKFIELPQLKVDDHICERCGVYNHFGLRGSLAWKKMAAAGCIIDKPAIGAAGHEILSGPLLVKVRADDWNDTILLWFGEQFDSYSRIYTLSAQNVLDAITCCGRATFRFEKAWGGWPDLYWLEFENVSDTEKDDIAKLEEEADY